MSGFDRDHEDRVKREMNVGNFDDFERLDNYALHEQPEAEERESELSKNDDNYVHDKDNGHQRALEEQQHRHDVDDLLLNFGKVDNEGDESPALFGSSHIGASVPHSTARPLVTTDQQPSPPEVQVCAKPVPETMEIHLTPDPDEVRAAEPFVNITGADHFEEEEEEEEVVEQRQPSNFDAYPLIGSGNVGSNYLIDDDDDNDDLDPVYEHPVQTGELYSNEDDDTSNRSTGGGHAAASFFPSAPPQRQEQSSSVSHHQRYYAEEIEEIMTSSNDKDAHFSLSSDDIAEHVAKKIVLTEEEGERPAAGNDLEPPKVCVCPPNPSDDAAVADRAGQCPCAWFKAENLDPRVAELIYWRDVKKTAIVFGSGLAVLLSLTYFSLISVLAYSLLAVVVGTISYRIYKNVLQAVQKSGDGHPFKTYLDMELSLPQDKLHEVAEIVVTHLESIAKKLRRLFLVEDIFDSLKFAVMLWCFTYVGAWFNGLTLFTLAFVALFTLPKVYETYQTEIDLYVEIAATQVNGIISKVKAKIPIGNKQKVQ